MSDSSSSEVSFSCSPTTGAPPIRTSVPATKRPFAYQGRVLSFNQNGTPRYACLNLPQQAQRERDSGTLTSKKWPLLIYLHGSLTTPMSLYLLGRGLFQLRHTFPLSHDPATQGFIILSPEGRKATPWPATTFQTGTGWHWDEWYRDPADNLDALAIDHFLDETIATGLVDTRQIYLFGWSNGAYMSALYGVWRSERIAAIGQYAGADPWSRLPCPVPLQYTRQVPLILLRNLCDALVPYDTTTAWIETLTQAQWPFEHYNLGLWGEVTAVNTPPACSKARGVFEHVRWPRQRVFQEHLLPFFKKATL